MSVDTVEAPAYGETAPASSGSGKKWFTCCGIGCVVVVLLCGVGALVTYFVAGDQLKAMYEQALIQQSNLVNAMESEAVKEKLGEPIQPVIEIAMPNVSEDGDAQIIESRQKLQGPDNEGVLVSVVRIEAGSVEQTELYLEVGDEKIDLMDVEDEINLDIDDGNLSEDGDAGEGDVSSSEESTDESADSESSEDQ